MGGLPNLIHIIKYHGGILRTLQKLLLSDTAKIGHLVGEDEFGNRYYENNYYFYPRNRWVIYSRKVGYDYDASQVSARYFNWLHNMTDVPPCYDETKPVFSWILPHTENLTGTRWEYVPYNTVPQKVHAWNPNLSRNLFPSNQVCFVPEEPDISEITSAHAKKSNREEKQDKKKDKDKKDDKKPCVDDSKDEKSSDKGSKNCPEKCPEESPKETSKGCGDQPSEKSSKDCNKESSNQSNDCSKKN